MNFQNAFASADIRTGNDHAPIKSTWSKESRIKYVRTVGRSNQNYAIVRFKPVHFDQQLVQRLFALVMTSTEAGATMTANRIDLVNINNAGRVLLPLFKQVANA